MNRKILLFAVLFSVAAGRAQANGFLNSYDRQIVAACMVLEAGGEGQDGMQAVLNVMLNRAKGDFGQLVPVTVKYGAFSCMASIWKTNSPDYGPLLSRAQRQPGPFIDAMNLIALMEQGQLQDNTHGATHYHADYVSPYWVSDMHYLTTIGHHYFYVERGREIASI